MPVTILASLGSVLYVQMKMIATTAQMAGYDLKCDLVHACLAGVSITEVSKTFDVQLGEKLGVGMIKKIPGTVLARINQRLEKCATGCSIGPDSRISRTPRCGCRCARGQSRHRIAGT